MAFLNAFAKETLLLNNPEIIVALVELMNGAYALTARIVYREAAFSEGRPLVQEKGSWLMSSGAPIAHRLLSPGKKSVAKYLYSIN